MSILSALGLSSSTKRRSKLKRLPKIPKGLVARAKRAQAKAKREKEIEARYRVIEALRKAAAK